MRRNEAIRQLSRPDIQEKIGCEEEKMFTCIDDEAEDRDWWLVPAFGSVIFILKVLL